MSQSATEKSISELQRRKTVSRRYLRSLAPEEKVRQALLLQERYYGLLVAREHNGGRQIPEKWLKWHRSRHGEGLNS